MSERIEFSHLELAKQTLLCGAAARPSTRDSVDVSHGWTIWLESASATRYMVKHKEGPLEWVPETNVKSARPILASEKRVEAKPVQLTNDSEPVVKSATATKDESSKPKSKLPPRRGAAPVATEGEPVA